MTTGELTDYTVDALAMFGVTIRRNNVGQRGRYRYGIKDWPDLLGYDGRGRFWGIEVKNRETKDRSRGNQNEVRREMAESGCQVAVVTCMEDVDRLIGEVR